MDHLAVTGCTLERLAQALLGKVSISGPALTEQEIEVNMATIALESVIPHSIARVPTEKIIAFRKRHAAERANFQEHLHKIVTEVGGLQEITDREALRAQLEVMHEKQLKPQLDEYKRRLNALGIDTVMGALNVRPGAAEAWFSLMKFCCKPAKNFRIAEPFNPKSEVSLR